jgi:hypothetical protein
MAKLDLINFPHQLILQALKDQPDSIDGEYFVNQISHRVQSAGRWTRLEAVKRNNLPLRTAKIPIDVHCTQDSRYHDGLILGE